MTRPLLSGSIAVLSVLAVACGRDAPPAPPAAGSPAQTPQTAAPVVASATPSASAQPKAAALSASDRTTVLKALEEGRKKSRAKDFTGALSAFDRALALAPDDARVLAEVGWAALNAGDLTRADAANRRALANVKEKTLRAQILYNAGRVAEAKKDTEAARKAYAESLALRDNAEVGKRLADVSGSSAPAAPSCDAGAPSIEALCKCLLGLPETPFVLSDDQKPVCSARPSSPSLGSPRLSIVRYGASEDVMGERVYLLVANDGGVFRPVTELGRDYMPGAFGVHNSATVLGGEARTVGSRSVIVIKSELRNSDQNMAGLELCSESIDQETVCALREGKPTRCVNVPVIMITGCGPGFEPDPKDIDAATKESLDNLRTSWGTTKVKLAWSIGDSGALTTKVVEGPPSDAKPSSVGTHPLF